MRLALSTAAMACVASLCAAPVTAAPVTAAEVTRGPYLQLATPESVTVVWRTDGPIDPVVRYGAAPDELDAATRSVTVRVSADVAAESPEPYSLEKVLYDEPYARSADRRVGDRDPSTPAGTYQYEARIDGLSPGEVGYYAVCDGDRVLAGADAEHRFAASPAAGTPADLRLWVVGDSGNGSRDQHRVFEAMRAFAASSGRSPDAFIHVGDMAYGDGADVEFQRFFFDVYQPTLRNTVCWPTMGNHEGHTSRGVSQFGPYYDAYVLPTGGEAGGVASGTEAYYSFDLGKVHFVCLDSHDLDRSASGAMARWLQADLEMTHADWLIAFWHHPPYTKGSHDSDRERQLIEMREHLMPLLEAGGVDLVLSGHSHIYERSMLIDGAYATPTVGEGVVLDDGDGRPDGDGPYRKSAGLEPHNGTVAIVAGHGGAGTSRKGTMPIMREIILENGSVILDLAGDTLDGVMIDQHGARRDHFQLVKRGRVEHTPIADPWLPEHDPSLITEQRIAFSTSDLGRAPAGWTVLAGGTERLLVEKRDGMPTVRQLVVTAGDRPTLLVYDDFEGPVSEVEGFLEFDADADAVAGLAFACESEDRLWAVLIDPSASQALVVNVVDGEVRVVSQREIDVDFGQPIKIELEPGEGLLEVQINDSIEYTAALPEPLPPGRVGIAMAEGASIRFGGMVVERAR
ncbi:metallophosphoesterase [Botrimarina sp.]|uniref:metallophosphoesterase n=1 Tax=Botrimarina sp. TaxID=2795802 RepID=UPI0032EB3572